MDRQTENEVRKKILRGEELTDKEKQQLGMDYDEWKQIHEESQESLLETYRWGSWPMLFICGFFLLSTAVNNTRYLMNGGQADNSVVLVAVVGWILGLASVILSFWMKKVSRLKQMQRAQRAQDRAEKESLMSAFKEMQADEVMAESAAETPADGAMAEKSEEMR